MITKIMPNFSYSVAKLNPKMATNPVAFKRREGDSFEKSYSNPKLTNEFARRTEALGEAIEEMNEKNNVLFEKGIAEINSLAAKIPDARNPQKLVAALKDEAYKKEPAKLKEKISELAKKTEENTKKMIETSDKAIDPQSFDDCMADISDLGLYSSFAMESSLKYHCAMLNSDVKSDLLSQEADKMAQKYSLAVIQMATDK